MTAADRKKRTSQRQGVWATIKSGRWIDLYDLRARVKGSDAALTARIRDLRKKAHGKHKVLCERFADGVYRYRLVK